MRSPFIVSPVGDMALFVPAFSFLVFVHATVIRMMHMAISVSRFIYYVLFVFIEIVYPQVIHPLEMFLQAGEEVPVILFLIR